MPNTSIVSDGATLNESDATRSYGAAVFHYPTVIMPFDLFNDIGTVRFIGKLAVKGKNGGYDPSVSTIGIGNPHQGWFIDEIEFTECQGYALQIGAYGYTSFRARNGKAQKLTFNNCFNQTLFLQNAENCLFETLNFNYTKSLHPPEDILSVGAIIDFEPNSDLEKIKGITFDTLNINWDSPTICFQAIALNYARTSGIEDVEFRNLKIASTGGMVTGITGSGIAGLKMSNVDISGMTERAMDFYGGSEFDFKNITTKEIGYGSYAPNGEIIKLGGICNSKFTNIKNIKPNNNIAYKSGILEYEIAGMDSKHARQ